jgi:uncharacterized protein (UPF0276 family)
MIKPRGVGVGLRAQHYSSFLRGEVGPARWVEVNAERYLPGERQCDLQVLELVRETMPVVLHGTSMSLAAATDESATYLAKLEELCSIIEPAFVSDHLCWSGIHGVKLHDLLPVPFTEESIDVIATRILAAQDQLRRPILVENLSSYVTHPSSEMTEWEFISAIVRRTDCLVLLDINNVYVSCSNHGWDARAYLDGIPHDRVRQIHLAGHADHGHVKLDTHGETVIEPVWDLYRAYLARHGAVPTMIEWDSNIPPWEELARELAKIEAILDEVSSEEKQCA